MQKKIASQQTRSFNELLDRGSVSWEEIEKYFLKKEVFSATPNDSRSVGNCASGTRDWMVINKFINHQGPVSWDDFPVPIDQPYSLTVKTALRLAQVNNRFKAVMEKTFTNDNPQKASLSSEQVQKVLFQSSEEILTTDEIILLKQM